MGIKHGTDSVFRKFRFLSNFCLDGQVHYINIK